MKKFLSLVLVLAMVFALCVPAFADEQEETYNYVSFGASNTNGYGLQHYAMQEFYNFIGTSEQTAEWNEKGFDASAWDPTHKMDIAICGYRRAPEGCYPDLIRDSLEADGKNVQFDQFAMSSMRVEELRVLLDNDYTGDSYTKWRFYDPDKTGMEYDLNGGVDVMREYVQNAVKNADLITYDMGANNFGVYLSLRLMNGKFDNDFADIYGEEAAAKFYDMREQIESKVIEMFGGILTEDTFITLDDMCDTFAYALLGYCYNFDKTMGIIRELNPDADIVVLSIQNNISDLVVTYGGIEIPLGELFSAAADMANVYMTSISEYKDEYCYADVRQNGHVELFFDEIKEYNGDPYSLDQSIIDSFNVLDNNLYLQIEVTRMLEARGILPDTEEYEKALYSAYDAMATIISTGANIESMPIDGILSGVDTGDIEDDLLATIREIYLEAANFAIDNPDEEYDVESRIQDLLKDDNYKAVALLGIRTSIGNSFYAHPNYNGHIQLRDAVLTALEEETTGNEALVKALIGLKDHLTELGITYGIDGAKLAAEKILAAFGVENASEAIDKLVDSEALADYIIDKAGLNTTDKITAAEKILSGTQSFLKAQRESLTYVAKKAATLFSSGHTAYYKCIDSGKLFSDVNGLNEITAASTVIPSKLTSLFSRFFR